MYFDILPYLLLIDYWYFALSRKND